MSDEAIIQGTTSANSTLADGTLRIKIDIPPADADAAYQHFGKPGQLVALAPLKSSPQDMQRSMIEDHNGAAYEVLYREGFFKYTKVCEAVGSDKQYLEWLKGQRCMLHGPDCQGDIVPAHVRRVSAGSGTGKKPEFSAVPMCDAHHQKQHNEGYSAIGGIERMENKAHQYRAKWVAEKIAEGFDVSGLRELDLARFMEFAEQTGVDVLLPGEFREYL